MRLILILLASSNKKLLARWEQGLLGFSPIWLSTNCNQVKDKLVKNKPEVLLLDYDLPELDGADGIINLLKFNSDAKVVIFSPLLADEIEWELFRMGIRGCCRNNIEPEQINFAIKAIQHGELWIRRTLTNFMLQELVEVTKEKNRIEQAVNDLLENLTRREYEIAMLVGCGESNKRIASKLAITERTVKAHMTEIFRKLHISDRIKLALMMKDTISSLNQSKVSDYNDPPYFI
jgi:DNA-binding NarL/FixJ family response regulator